MTSVRRLIKNNRGSYYINIPKEIIKSLRWQEGQKLDVDFKAKTVFIVDWKK